MLYAIAVVLVLIADQAVKYWTILNIAPQGAAKPFIPGFIELVNHHNTGAAFGIFQDGRWFFIAVTAIAVIAIIFVLSRGLVTAKLGRWSLVMIMAGGLGNFIDRLVNGYVVDMFSFEFKFPIIGDFPIFNVADIFVSVFGVVFCLFLIFHREPEKAEKAPPARPLPKATGRPKQGVDYLTQLQKPVVEGREAIEHELAAKEKPAPAALDESFSAWNMPKPESAAVAPPAPPAAPRPAPKPSARPEAPVPRDFEVAGEPEKARPPKKQPALSPDPFAASPARPTPPPAAPKKSETEFSLEDILAEFKD